MREKNIKHTLFIILLIILSLFLSHFLIRIISKPKIILWAWERPENMMFIKDKNIGVAFYAGAIEIKNGEFITKPRKNSLIVDPEKKLIAVIRVDNFSNENSIEKYISEMSEFIVQMCKQKNVFECQIDFDAKESERETYKKIISNVKNGLPPHIDLSITVLVSWCGYDNWIKDLPISEAVPMFYRLGFDERYIKSGFDQGEKECAKSIGVSMDEPFPDKKYFKGKKIYIFNPEPWTEESFSMALELINN